MDQYKIIENVLDKQTIELVKNTLLITKDAQYIVNGVSPDNTTAFGDHQTEHSWTNFGHPVCEGLLETLRPKIEEAVGKSLFPTYSFCRIYWPGAVLKKHRDRPSCEYSVSLCIDNDPEPWPIYFGGDEAILQPGDAVVYKGLAVEHWRETYTGRQQIQIFLHYVDQQGPHNSWKYDKRLSLGIIRGR